MSTGSVGSVSYAQLTSKNRAPKKEMDKDDFLNLMITQLKNQDPLSPMDNSEFIAQTTQFSSLEQLINISKALENQSKSSKESQLLNGATFLGKDVKYYGKNFNLEGGNAKLQFTLSDAAKTATISIYNSAGSVVATGEFNDLPAGFNTIPWDGTGINGSKLTDGSYSYSIKAKDANGNEISSTSLASGRVKGVAYVDGKLVFNVNGFSVDSSSITEVNESSN
ncbi:MAG: flagellar hook assembly protein FlgD [Calditerrivibrio sp.]|nr:flagellar hook assembly protein FlgD [Calditerrivibrio sp.]